MATTADTALKRRSLFPGLRHPDPEEQRLWRLRVLFYLGVPLVIGFLLAWWRVGRAGGAPLDVAIAYWVGMALVTTWVNDLAARPFAAVARPRGVPLWIVLLASQALAGPLLLRPLAEAYAGFVGGAFDFPLLSRPGGSLQATFLQWLPSNAVMWIGLNMLFLHGLGLPRLGYLPRGARQHPGPGVPPSPSAAPVDGTAPDADGTPVPQPSAAAAGATPTFMERVRPERRGAVLALRAEGHYLRVYTTAGSELVLYRLSDAAAELAADEGIQVHRSWWVAERALGPERHADRLRLVNGVEVPVSRSYRLAARTRGWLA